MDGRVDGCPSFGLEVTNIVERGISLFVITGLGFGKGWAWLRRFALRFDWLGNR